MHGSPLVLSGQFLPAPEPPLDTFLTDLRNNLAKPIHIPTRHNATATLASPTLFPAQLLQASFVLVRRDDHVSSLVPRYEGRHISFLRFLHTFPLQIDN